MCKVGVFLSLRKKNVRYKYANGCYESFTLKMLYIVGSDQKGSEHTGYDFSLMLHINGLEGSLSKRPHPFFQLCNSCVGSLSVSFFSPLEDNQSLLNPLILLAVQAYILLRL